MIQKEWPWKFSPRIPPAALANPPPLSAAYNESTRPATSSGEARVRRWGALQGPAGSSRVNPKISQKEKDMKKPPLAGTISCEFPKRAVHESLVWNATNWLDLFWKSKGPPKHRKGTVYRTMRFQEYSSITNQEYRILQKGDQDI